MNRFVERGWRSLRPTSSVGWVAVVAAVITVATQIPYPLVSDDSQRILTIASVLSFFVASTMHALDSRGVRAVASLVLVCVGGGVLAEAIGWRTGLPFGNYRYNDSLGIKVLGVPVVVALAWAMMGWIALLSGRRVAERCSWSGAKATMLVALIGSLVLVTWDLFLDPQMVDAGHWRWLPTPGPSLNGIPLMNSLGWLLVGVLMVLCLDLTVPVDRHPARSDTIAWALLGWTWFSEWFGHLVFFGRPAVALIGGLAMTSVLAVVVKPELIKPELIKPVLTRAGDR